MDKFDIQSRICPLVHKKFPNKGGILESLIIPHFYKQFYNHAQLPSLYFWRDKSGREIDCIINQGQQIVPVEIKSGRTVNPRFFEGIDYFKNLAAQNETLKQALANSKNNGYVVFAGSTQQIRPYSNLISWQETDIVFKD